MTYYILKKNDKIYCPFKMCISFRKLFRAIAFYYTRESENLLGGRELRWAYIFIFVVEKSFKDISLRVVNIILQYSISKHPFLIRGWIYKKSNITLYVRKGLILHLFRNTLEASAQPLHLLWLFVCTLRKTNTKLRRIKGKVKQKTQQKQGRHWFN